MAESKCESFVYGAGKCYMYGDVIGGNSRLRNFCDDAGYKKTGDTNATRSEVLQMGVVAGQHSLYAFIDNFALGSRLKDHPITCHLFYASTMQCLKHCAQAYEAQICVHRRMYQL